MNVLIVDDHEIFRMGVRSRLTTAPDIVVVGEADHGEAALAFMRESHCADAAR